MTVLDALAILEAATLECKQRDIYTPEVKEALNFLERRIWPDWLIPRFRYYARLNEKNGVDVDKEAKQQALRAIFPRIRESVKDPPGKQRGYTY
jgi:allantoicase